MILLCERCWRRIDRAREPLRLIPRQVPDLSGEQPALRLHGAVHARSCSAPDVGDWNPVRRGVAPAGMQRADEQADHR